jgi:hypothetical protein
MALVFGSGGWSRRKAVVVVRTYPAPARKGVEVSCTAAVSEQGEWLRLFPVPYRFLKKEQRFSKYQFIEANLKKATSDTRPESHNVDLDSLRALDEHMTSDDYWRARSDLLEPLRRQSMEAIEADRAERGYPTLGFFKPKRIKRLRIKPDSDGPDWNAEQKAKLRQEMGQGKLWDDANAPEEELEKVPYVFSYEFECDDSACRGHEMSCTDWEMGEAYRKWLSEYRNGWEHKFRQRFEIEMIQRFDTHFFVGTVHVHPGTWIIVGLFYPLVRPPGEPERPRLL